MYHMFTIFTVAVMAVASFSGHFLLPHGLASMTLLVALCYMEPLQQLKQ